ncbi:MAG: glucokinase [Solirubrobacteraceae bacterium]|jgi:glucokinase|nr:glucokinase [Solirubrobacteraceae bacterium]
MTLRAGIDLGGTKVQAIVVDDDHRVVGQARMPTPRSGGPDDVVETLAEAVREACQDAEVKPKELTGIGLGSPGAIDSEAGTVANAKNLPGWTEAPVAVGKKLAKALGSKAPIRIGNDVDVATRAEFELGAAAEYDSLLGVFWGTGVGGGVILNGAQWNGRGSAGEIGHMVVIQGGRTCPCGREGCMEAYAGRAALEARARKLHEEKGRKTDLFHIMRERDRDRLSSGIWSRAVDRGDELAIELLEEAVAAIGTAAASAVNLLDPEAVVIGGGLGVRFGAPYVEKIRAAMLPHLFRDDDPPAIMLAELGDLGGALGAALLVARPT